MKMKVRVVDNVLGYVKTLGSVEDWRVKEREGMLGLENAKMGVRVRGVLKNEKTGDSWDTEVEE